MIQRILAALLATVLILIMEGDVTSAIDLNNEKNDARQQHTAASSLVSSAKAAESVMSHIVPLLRKMPRATTPDLNYSLDQPTTGQATVTGLAGSQVVSDLSIPATCTVGGVEYTVSAIADNAFKENEGISRVVIPDTVSSIGISAFAGCTSLEEVTMRRMTPETTAATVAETTVVKDSAFRDCLSLDWIELDEHVDLASGCFYNCAETILVQEYDTAVSAVPAEFLASFNAKTIKLRCHDFEFSILDEHATVGISPFCEDLDIVIPSSVLGCEVTAIATDGFRSHTPYIRSVKIPATVTIIEHQAFQDSPELTSVELPNGLTTIGYLAFAGSGLTSITVPSTVTSMGSEVFQDCSELTEVEILGALNRIERSTFNNCINLVSVRMQESDIATIGEEAFWGCENLANVQLPDGLTTIEDNVFANCAKLKTLPLPSKLTTIGPGAFSGCGSITSIDLPPNLTAIEKYVFDGCTSLTSVIIPPGVTSIGESAFGYCESLVSVEIPDSVRTISELAFEQCPQLAMISIGSGIESIAAEAFESSPSIETVVFSGATSKWKSIAGTTAPQLPDTALIWCSDGIIGNVESHVTVSADSGNSGEVYSTQTNVQVDTTFTGTIPKSHSVRAVLELTGMKFAEGENGSILLSSPVARVATPETVTVSRKCSVSAGSGDAVSARIALVEGQPWTGTAWTKVVESSPAVSVSTVPANSPFEPGQTITVILSVDNAPADGLDGTVMLTGLTDENGKNSISFTATSDQNTFSYTCTVNDDADSASVSVGNLKIGDLIELAAPATGEITLMVASPQKPNIPPVQSPPDTSEPPSGDVSTSPPVTSPSSSSSPSGQNPSHGGSVSFPSSNRPESSPGSGQHPSTGGTSHEPSASASSSPVVSAMPEPTATAIMPIELRPDASGMPEDVKVIDNDDSSGSSLLGVVIGSLWGSSPAELIESWVAGLDDSSYIKIVKPDGDVVKSEQQVATGMLVQVVDDSSTVIQETTIVVRGDVLGTGEISLSQVVRIAQAYTGANPLEGAYELAGDLTGDGAIQLSDVIQETKLYIGDTLRVDYSVVEQSSNVAEALDSAGYDISPWTDEVAVFAADIPEGAEVESIAWTQRDVFPDGREQELYYEGSEESLIFGTYTEGKTTITAVVTTAAGKTGSHSTEIVWDSAAPSGQRTAASERAVTRPSSTPSPTDAPISTHSPTPSGTRPVSSAASGTASPSSVVTAAPTSSSSPQATTSAAAVPSGAPSPVDLLNTFRIEVVVGTNGLRANNHISPMLIPSTRLSQAAMVRAQEMAKAGKLSHTRPDGSKYSTVVELGKGIVIGENIHSNKGYPTLEVAQIAVHGWENSAPHRKQILEKRYTHTGIGFVQAADGKWYCVQVFSNGDKVLSIDTPKA